MKTALIIGDSHVDPSGAMPFGRALTQLLAAKGYSVTQAGVGGTNAYQWAHQGTVCNNVGRCVNQASLPRQPDLLVISLGTNDAANALAGGRSMASSVADVERIVAQYAPGKVFWIGPPATRRGTAYSYYTNEGVAAYYAAAARSSLPIFDSRAVTKPHVDAGSGDGVHLGAQGVAAWAQAAVDALPALSNTAKVAIAFGAVGALTLLLWKKGYI